MNIRNPFGIVEGKLKHIKDINKGDKIMGYEYKKQLGKSDGLNFKIYI